ncbi:recombinase family protein [Pararhizobium sp. LjRoot255]|uniref:recombinase family protein n=1 Tax=Pararhizobium sp. LjRoot255 TaxID=3342298 RepID=UPI003ECEF51E
MAQRAAIYCRVSTVDQSCERQERDLMAFAGRAGYDIAASFKETGFGAKLDRTERKKVMVLAQSRQIDVILVTELSRWGRSTIDLLNTLRELESWKASVIVPRFDRQVGQLMQRCEARPHGLAVSRKTTIGNRPRARLNVLFVSFSPDDEETTVFMRGRA